MPTQTPPIVVKVGGSLFDLPDLGCRLAQFLTRLDTNRIVLVPGGGRMTDAVRELDQQHSLGDEAAHWLALRTLTVNAHFLAAILTPRLEAVVSGDVSSWSALWQDRQIPIADPFALSISNDLLPHSWDATSDSIAAGIAKLIHAPRLILLKSVSCASELTWEDASKLGLVDLFFPSVSAGLDIEWINFRDSTSSER